MRNPRRGVKLPRPGLTEKQARFVENMAKIGMSKQEAALEAGYSRGIAEADRLLQNEEIVRRINERKRLAAEFCHVSPEAIIGATAARAFASIDDAYDDAGNFDIEKARRTGAIHLIKKLEKTKYGYKVEFYSADTAQERLGNYLGLDKAPADNNDINSLRTAVEQVAEALASGGEVTPELRREAWRQVFNWTTENRARYSQQAIKALQEEYGA